MKFKLVENMSKQILCESTMYKVPLPNNKFCYLLARDNLNNIYTYQDLCNYIDRLKRNDHEVINFDLYSQLQALGTSSVSISPLSLYSQKAIVHHPGYAKKMINTTYTTNRKRDHRMVHGDVKGGTPKLRYSDLTVHHLDGCEANEDPENLVGFDNDAIHQLAHVLPVVSSGSGSITWSKRFPAAIYDGSNFVTKPCRVTIDIK